MSLIDLLRRLDEGATEDWEVGGPYPGVSVIRQVEPADLNPECPEPAHYDPVAVLDQRTEGPEDRQALLNARLIATVRNLLPAILRELEAGRAIADCPDAVEQDAYCYDYCEVSAGLMDAYRAARAAADEEARKNR